VTRRLALAALVAGLVTLPVPADDAAKVREEVFDRLDRGVLALKRGDAIAAQDDLCWAHSRALNNHTAAWYCGRAALEARAPDVAVDALELAVELDEEHLGSHVALGHAYIGVGDLDRARAAFFRALEIRRDHSPAWTGLARLAEVGGDRERAFEMYETALEANPADADARAARGALYLRDGRLDEALDDIREAARLRPDDGSVQVSLARVLLATGLHDDALAATRRALALTPDEPAAHALMATVFARVDALPEAEEAARAALALDEQHPDAILALAEVYGRTGRLDEALALLDGADLEYLTPEEREALTGARAAWAERARQVDELAELAEAPEAPPELIADLARARLETGDEPGAEALARRLASAEGTPPDVLRRAAYVIARVGKPLDAERVLTAALEAAGARAPVDWVNLGVLRERSGDAVAARAAYETALAYDDEPAPEVARAARAGLARLALAEGSLELAASEIRALLDLNPPTEMATRAEKALERLDALREGP
jgi:tetratricopeptide (TPR) repeat protein